METQLLSIDGSMTSTGYSILLPSNKDVIFVNRVCTDTSHNENYRIMYIIDHLLDVSAKYDVKDMVIEGGYSGANIGTALMLAKLRGGIIATFMKENIFSCEMQPAEIRMWLGENGAAKKEQVAAWILEMYKNNPMVQEIGPYSDRTGKKKTSDMYDAIGIGVGYLNMIQANAKK